MENIKKKTRHSRTWNEPCLLYLHEKTEIYEFIDKDWLGNQSSVLNVNCRYSLT